MKKILFIGDGGYFKEQYFYLLKYIKYKGLDFVPLGVISENKPKDAIEKFSKLNWIITSIFI